MANDTATGVTLLGAFIGAAIAAWWKLRGGKPTAHEQEKAEPMDHWKNEVDKKLADHSARLERVEIDRVEQREDLGKVFEKLEELSDSNARIEGALGIHR